MEAFYSKLGFEVRKDGARYEILAPAFKINLHIKGHELEPKAALSEPGTGDFCIEISTDKSLQKIEEELRIQGLNVVSCPVERHGRRGTMTSIYLRDPDKNLVELALYPRSSNKR
nr:hypothetical protein [Turicimonas muris]